MDLKTTERLNMTKNRTRLTTMTHGKKRDLLTTS